MDLTALATAAPTTPVEATPLATALGLLAVVVLVLGNAWFVAAEFALVASRRSRLEAAVADGDRAAERSLRLLERLSFTLSGAQLGITVTSLAVGFIAEPVFTALFSPALRPLGIRPALVPAIAVTVGLVASTALQMIVGELGPKNLAIAKAEDVARRVAAAQLVYLRIFGPIIRLFDGAANRLIRLAGIEPAEEIAGAVTMEELEHIIASSQESGALDAGVSALLTRSIDFRSLKADDAMRPRGEVTSISAEASCEQLAELAGQTGHSRFPVTGPDGLDDVVGVIGVKDLLEVTADQRSITPVRTLVEPELAVPESAPLREVLLQLRDTHTQLAIVVDEFGGTAGIITLEDIVEELVGDIRDEHDAAERRAVRRADGSWRVPGLWRIDEVRRDTGIELPTGEHDTVSGLVMSLLSRVPEAGDVVHADGIAIEVVAVHRHVPQTVRLSPLPTAEEIL